jgi:hypothetical protein
VRLKVTVLSPLPYPTVPTFHVVVNVPTGALGQVPHCGCFVALLVNPIGVPKSKLVGFDGIKVTHQFEIS